MTDALATHFPVSIKVIVETDDGYVLLKNERNEWELPGGKLEASEELEACAIREVAEETGLAVEIEALAHSWIYRVNNCEVVIVAYKAKPLPFRPEVSLSAEHKQIGIFPADRLIDLDLPQGYRDAIRICQATGKRN
jgi:8-oxo-dGTP pyrophosphatase MutT (NUDIX family)